MALKNMCWTSKSFSNWASSTMLTADGWPVPMLTRQTSLLLQFQIRSASTNASLAGLLYPSPPSTYVIGGSGFSIVIGLKKDGAALVARAASQIAHLLRDTPSAL